MLDIIAGVLCKDCAPQWRKARPDLPWTEGEDPESTALCAECGEPVIGYYCEVDLAVHHRNEERKAR